MTLRACVYKNCESYSFHGLSSPKNVTIFQFPKDPERRQLWIDNGQVPETCPISALYMCSLHFDRKYLCINNRRTILIGQAVPSAYVDNDDIDNEDIDDDDDDGGGAVDDVDDNEDLSPDVEDLNEHSNSLCFTALENAVSVTDSDLVRFTDELQGIDREEPSSSKKEHYQKIAPNVSRKDAEAPCSAFQDPHNDNQYGERKLNVKRKADSPVKKYMIKKNIGVPANTVASTTMDTCPTSAANNLNEANNDHDIMDTVDTGDNSEWNENAVDASHVTTFIFKGEEYVQMPKRYYMREKSNLLKSIHVLEMQIKRIRDSVNMILETND